jgi:hypothetical protein
LPTDPAELVVYPTGVGQPRKLERGGLVSYEVGGFFPDGKRIFVCGHEAGHAVRCYLQNLEGAGGDTKPRPITPEGTHDAYVSPDGTQLVATDSKGAMGIYPVTGAAGAAAARPVPGTSADDAAIGWMSDGKSVLIATHWWEVPLKIQKVDLPTGRREDVATLRPGELTGAVQIIQTPFTPDGKSYAYAVRRMASHLFLVQAGQ